MSTSSVNHGSAEFMNNRRGVSSDAHVRAPKIIVGNCGVDALGSFGLARIHRLELDLLGLESANNPLSPSVAGGAADTAKPQPKALNLDVGASMLGSVRTAVIGDLATNRSMQFLTDVSLVPKLSATLA